MPVYGPYAPATASNDSSIGSIAWDNPNNALVSDDIYSTAPLPISTQSNYLKLTNFSIGPLPSTDVITGISLTVTRKASVASIIQDYNIKLVVNNVVVGTSQATTDYWSTSEENAGYGGQYELWGLSSLSNSQVEASNFGIVISAKNDSGSGFPRIGYIDDIQIYVWTSAGSSLSDVTTLFITGYIPINSGLPLVVINNPVASISGSQKLYVKGSAVGITELFSYTDLFYQGYLTKNSGVSLYLNSNPSTASIIPLYTKGITSSNNNLPLFVQQVPQTSGTAGMIMFTKGLNPADSIPPTSGRSNNYTRLYTYGGAIAVGDPDIPGGIPSPLTQMNIFLAGALKDDEASNMNLFIKNIPFSSRGSTQLFLYNNTEPINNNVRLYTKGLGSVDSEGYTPGGSYMNLFIQRNIAGGANLFMIGPKYNVNNSANLYINSNPTKASGMALSLPYSWSNLNNGSLMYVNGW